MRLDFLPFDRHGGSGEWSGQRMGIEKLNQRLLQAVIEPRKYGAIRDIEEACAAGADPNRICPDTSSSRGPVRAGSTLLTHAIHEGSSRAVEKLLAGGADPNLMDELGWTPWMASTLVDESKRDRIQELLRRYGARREGDSIGELARAIYDGAVDRAAGLFASTRDLEILPTFRVDLVRHTINAKNTPMLELLIRHGLEPTLGFLGQAVRHRYLAGVDLFLRHGAPPEDDGREGESLLMEAAATGELEIVERLVEAGADVDRYAWDTIEWTAAHRARQAGHDAVADWLTARMDKGLLDQIRQIRESRDPRFQPLYDKATASEDLTTDEIVATLARWDGQYGIEIGDVDPSSATLRFLSLPADLDRFYEEVERLCPDVCENKGALLDELEQHATLRLWWD